MSFAHSLKSYDLDLWHIEIWPILANYKIKLKSNKKNTFDGLFTHFGIKTSQILNLNDP